MTADEHLDLNMWISEHVFGRKWYVFDTRSRTDVPQSNHRTWCALINGDETWPKKLWNAKCVKFPPHDIKIDRDAPHYTSDRAESDRLEEKILEKTQGYVVCYLDGEVLMKDEKVGVYAMHKDRMICRALFAKEIFKPKK